MEITELFLLLLFYICIFIKAITKERSIQKRKHNIKKGAKTIVIAKVDEAKCIEIKKKKAKRERHIAVTILGIMY